MLRLLDGGTERRIGDDAVKALVLEAPVPALCRDIPNRLESISRHEGRKQAPEVFKDDIRLSPAKVRTVVSYLAGRVKDAPVARYRQNINNELHHRPRREELPEVAAEEGRHERLKCAPLRWWHREAWTEDLCAEASDGR